MNPSRPDRRANPRFVPRDGVAVECQPWTVLSLVDLSITGIRLYLNPPMRPGTTVAVTLHAPADGTTIEPSIIQRSATVVWVHSNYGIACTAGIAFDRELSAEDFDRLVDSRR